MTPRSDEGPPQPSPAADHQLLDRVVTALARGTPSPDEPALLTRLDNPAARQALRRRLESYATAAPEYIDEDLQAAARTFLAKHFGKGQ